MDLSIETLAGTSFDLRVSPFETIMGVKVKIQKREGIPVSQQHLIWKSMELKDDCCLHDYSISSGSSLKLVLAMRGGPINTRRVSVGDPTLREMAEYMEANRDEIWDKLIRDDNQVTLLVFREGDQLNFYRIYDRGDGTLTPLSDSISPASLCGVPSDDTVEENPDDSLPTEQQTENEMIRHKLSSLRQKMAIGKKPAHDKKLVPCPPPVEKPDSLPRRRLPFTPLRRYVSSNLSPPATVGNPGDELSQAASRSALPPLSRKSLVSSSSGRHHHMQADSSSVMNQDDDFLARTCCPSYERSHAPLPSMRSSSHGYKSSHSSSLSSMDRDVGKSTSSTRSKGTSKEHPSGKLHRSSRRSTSRRVVEYIPDSAVTGEETPSKAEVQQTRIKEKLNDHAYTTYSHQSNTRKLPSLPSSFTSANVVASQKRQRCITCRKRLGLATTFQCRCGNNFCGIHRYPETHQCTFDYKSEGRKALARNNPIVAAPKLPKI